VGGEYWSVFIRRLGAAALARFQTRINPFTGKRTVIRHKYINEWTSWHHHTDCRWDYLEPQP
jgi:hypothetical protein